VRYTRDDPGAFGSEKIKLGRGSWVGRLLASHPRAAPVTGGGDSTDAGALSQRKQQKIAKKLEL